MTVPPNKAGSKLCHCPLSATLDSVRKRKSANAGSDGEGREARHWILVTGTGRRECSA